MTCSPCSGQRQNPVRSDVLSWLLPSLFPPSVSPPQCSLSLSQWQEEPAGPEMALLLWCERGFGGADGYSGGWRPRCGNLAVENCVHITSCGVKRAGELPSGVPIRGWQALCPWIDSAQTWQALGDPLAALVSLGSPTNSPKAELPPAQACHCPQGLWPVVIQSLTNRFQRGLGACGLFVGSTMG